MFLETSFTCLLHNFKKIQMQESQLSEPVIYQITQLAYNNFRTRRSQQRLDPNLLKQFKQQYIKPLYPYTLDQSGTRRKYQCCQACCFESPGNFCCFSTVKPDNSYTILGLATCLYMKFIKHSSIFLLFISLLLLTSCAVCFAVAVQNNFSPLEDYPTFFFSTTYGAFSSQHNKCQYAQVNSANNQAQISVSCPYGILNASAITSSIPLTLTNESLASQYNCKNQRANLQSNKYLAAPSLASSSQTNVTMIGNSAATATFTFNSTGIQTNQLVAYVYSCYSNVYNIGNIHAYSDHFFFYVVAVDLFFCIWFIVFFISEAKAEKREAEFFKKEQVSLSDFSIEITCISRNQLDKQLSSLLKHFQNNISRQFIQSLISITIPEIREELDQQQQRRQIYTKIYSLIDKYYFRNSEFLLPFNDCYSIVHQELSPTEAAELKSKISEYCKELINLKRRSATMESTQKISVYLIFTNVVMRERVIALQTKSCCSQSLVCKDPYGADLQFHLKQPPVPDMINGQNRKAWTKFRMIISWILTLAICAASYLLFGFIQYKQQQLTSNYNYIIDCGVIYPGVSFTTYDPTLNAQSSNYLTCYCKGQSLLNFISTNSGYCYTWQQQYILYKTIPLLISLGIVFFNAIVSEIFRIMTKLERHQFLQNEELSYSFKRAVLMILNMGLILILLNYNYNRDIELQKISYIFLGRYSDFTSDWYYNIGTMIILTLIFNIAFPIIELMIACVFKCFRKCWDTRCFNIPTSKTTKKEYIELNNDDIYPIGERYAYLISTFFISMSFCGVIPILIPVTAISLFLLYFSDKLLLFKHYQTPKNYTTTLHNVLLKVIYLSLLSHFALTALFLSQPTLIAQSATITRSGWVVNSGNPRINTMFQTIYILPYVISFALLVIFALFKQFILKVLLACSSCCSEDRPEYKSEFVQRSNFFNILSSNQAEMLKTYLEYWLQQIDLKKRQKYTAGPGRQEETPATTGNRLRQTDVAQFDSLTFQQQIMNHSLEQLSKFRGRERQAGNLKLLGLPSYGEHVQLEEVKAGRQMLDFEDRLKKIVGGDIMKALTDKLAAEAVNDSNEILIF